MKPLIYVVDGVPERRSVVQHVLQNAGYRVEVFATTSVLQSAEEEKPAAMVIATELPNGSRVALRERVRQHPDLQNVVTLMLTDNKIDEQDVPPDEYRLSFPVNPGRMISVLQTALGRLERSERDSGEVDIVIDASAMKILVQGRELSTTTLEFRLIDYLARHRGKVLTRDALLDAVWGDLQFVTPRSVDACIGRIRRKLERDASSPRFLRTIRGVGYRLEARPRWETADVCHCKTCMALRSRALAAVSERAFPPAKVLGRAAFLNRPTLLTH